jgi:hypothetical protein
MKTDLNFENDETKCLLAKMNFEFFLKENIDTEKYDNSDVAKIYSTFEKSKEELRTKYPNRNKQFVLYCEGQVRKMFTGGFLPALFQLDESRGHTFIDFIAVGESWAYFDYWRKAKNREITKKKTWEVVTKFGSIVAIILGILKVIEMCMTDN